MIGTVPWPLAIGLLLTTCGAAPLGYSARILFFAGLALRGTYLLA